MALTDVRLSLLAFPQRWTANALQARVLLLPAVDPMVAPGFGLPAFRGSTWTLRVTILPDPDALFGPDPGGVPDAVSFSFTAVPPDGAAALFDALNDQFKPELPPPPAVRQLSASAQI